MSEKSKIEWCDDTHNFWRGCVKVSPGCAHCYAEVSAPVRVARSEGRELWGGKLRDRAKDFDAPLRWNEKPWVCDTCGTPKSVSHAGTKQGFQKPVWCDKCETSGFHRRRVFSLSLGDWLDDAVPTEWLADMLDVIRRCPNLDWLLLTKRPENWRERMQLVYGAISDSKPELAKWVYDWFYSKKPILASDSPPANVWIGTTVENQEYADKRIPELLKIPAVCRFLSVEPMLGPIEFSDVTNRADAIDQVGKKALAGIRWCIVGGESGPRARPFNLEWARSTVAQCRAAGISCFVKQLGAKPIESIDNPYPPPTEQEEMNFKRAGFCRTQLTDGRVVWQKWPTFSDKKGGDPSEWSEDLRVREFPTVQQNALQ